MKLFSEDLEVLKELYKSGEVEIYHFHKIYHLSPAQLSRSIRKFSKIDIFHLEGNALKLTEKGKIWILANRYSLFLKERNKYWRNYKKEDKTRSLEPNKPFVPQGIIYGKTPFKEI